MPSVLFNREYSPSHAFSVHDYHSHRSDYSSLSLAGLDEGQLASPQPFDTGDMLFSMDQDESFGMAPSPTSPWGESYSNFSSPSSAALQSPFAASLEFDPASPSVYSPPAFEGASDPFLASISSSKDMNNNNSDALLASWIHDPTEQPASVASSASSSSAPIPIPTNASANDMQASFVAYNDRMGSGSVHSIPFPTSFSPSDFDLSVSPPSQHAMYAAAIAPQDTTVATPSWASNLWSSSGGMPQMHHRQYSHGAAQPYSFASRRAARQTSMSRSGNASAAFMSTSAPAAGIVAPPSAMQPQQHPTMHARQYSSGGILGTSSNRHDESSMGEDRDATVRRKNAAAFHELRENSVSSGSADEQLQLDSSAVAGVPSSSPPAKSHLKPPKLAPSAWQLYFTDWIQHQQSVSTRKLNVAQAAKEAGQDYANLSAKEKEPYKRRSQALKEARERELASYMKSLTPQDIKLENAYRTAQRKAGKSRKGNIKDPNAPKKPLSAYFMFLQVIRADADLVREVFGDETETTKQSVLAARKWRSMTDEERKPFLAKAEAEKILYEDARKLYEEGHGPSSSGLGGLSGSFSTSSATGSSTGMMMNFGVFSDGSATSGAALRLSSRRMSMTSESESDSGMLSSPGGDEGMHTFHFRS